mgnify:CR=1 FL=1
MTICCIYQGQRKTYTFDRNEVVVGRGGADCTPDLRLEKDLRISRRHARFYIENGVVFIEDLGSRGGVTVNHAQIAAPWELRPGDIVKIGDTVLSLEFEVAAMVTEDGEFMGTLDASVPVRRARVVQEEQQDEGTMFLRKEDLEEANVSAMEEVTIENQLDAWSRSLFFAEMDDKKLRARLKVLYDLPLQFAVEEDSDTLFKLILTRAMELIPTAVRGSVLAIEEGSGKLAVRHYVPEDEEPPVSRTLVKKAAGEGTALIWSFRSPGEATMQSGIYAPLIWHEKVIGMLYVDGPEMEKPFTNEDMRMLLSVAHYAAMMLEIRGW